MKHIILFYVISLYAESVEGIDGFEVFILFMVMSGLGVFIDHINSKFKDKK